MRGSSNILFSFVVIGIAALLVFLAAPFGEAFVPAGFAPVYLRAFFWPSAYSFIAGLAGIFLFLVLRLGFARARPARAALFGLALGLIAFSLGQVSRVPDHRIAWVSSPQSHLVRLDREVQARAAREGRPILYYFRADWCDICPDFERLILSRVARDTAPYLAVKMDVTDFERWHEYLESEYGVEATPTVILRDRAGRILTGTRFTGEHISVRALRTALHALASPPQ